MLKKEKRGQITIFVILAILIIAVVAGFFILRDKITFFQPAIPGELTPITNSIQECVQSTLEDGTKLAGLQGGYIIPPSNALETDFSYIAYGYYLGKNTLASKTQIENEIANYIELTLPFCFDASSFQEYRITAQNPTASVKINGKSKFNRFYLSFKLWI
jgi:hypothetical protein